LVSTKLDTSCYPTVQLHRATCRRFDTIPACVRRTDEQTDEIAIASIALAMRALQRAVKNIGPTVLFRFSYFFPDELSRSISRRNELSTSITIV